MKNDFKTHLINNIIFPRGIGKIFYSIFISICLLFVYLCVWFTGGTKYVYSHTMYIPIILSTMSFGITGGIGVGIIGGILLGPLMPLDTLTGESQLTINWIFRLIIFVIVGIVSGIMSRVFRNNTKKVIEFLTHNQDTGIPNLSVIYKSGLTNDSIEDKRIKLVMTLLVNKYDSIVEVISRDYYNIFIKEVFLRLKRVLPNDTKIIQASNHKLWLCFTVTDTDSIINKIVKALNNTFYIDKIPLFMEFSIGVVLNNKNLSLIETFKQADAAAYQAQREKSLYLIFEDRYLYNLKNIELLGMFRNALSHDTLEVYYQPKMDLRLNKPIGVEALLRWNHPNRGPISPLEIIPLVEETELINPLTNWVLKKSLTLMQKFQKQWINIKVSVNISTKNLTNPHFFTEVVNIINDFNIHTKNIEFEVTESKLMENPEASKLLLHDLSKYQIAISIDDYGTGYSSLAYLSQLPIDIVKIDKFFINNMKNDVGVKNIIKSTIDLVHSLGMLVVAEGVEQEEEAITLRDLDCDIAQGYYYARPIDEEALFEWFKNY